MNSPQEQKARRPYDASLRRARAEERRVAALRAAAEVFAERGLETTTMDELAQAAGVSVPYLERLGTKADIFAMAVEAQTVGAQEQSIARVWENMDAAIGGMTREELLTVVARASADWNARSHRLWRMWAVSSDSALQQSWRRRMADIRREWGVFLSLFDARAWWRADVPRAEQVATIWILTMAETYGRLIEEAGFTHEEYIAWLERGLVTVLVPPGEERSPRR